MVLRRDIYQGVGVESSHSANYLEKTLAHFSTKPTRSLLASTPTPVILVDSYCIALKLAEITIFVIARVFKKPIIRIEMGNIKT
jgi:hypothetical protein